MARDYASVVAMLDGLEVRELTALIKVAEEKRQEKLDAAKEELVAEFKAKAASLGLSLEGLLPAGAEPPRTRKPRADAGVKRRPKYRGPDGEEWSGRGRTPNWLTALEASGRRREEFATGAGVG